MMDRVNYIKMRKEGKYDLQWFYQYYLKNFDKLPKLIIEGKEIKRHLLQLPEFVNVFQLFLQMNGSSILEHLDRVFEVQKIENNNGELIYIN